MTATMIKLTRSQMLVFLTEGPMSRGFFQGKEKWSRDHGLIDYFTFQSQPQQGHNSTYRERECKEIIKIILQIISFERRKRCRAPRTQTTTIKFHKGGRESDLPSLRWNRQCVRVKLSQLLTSETLKKTRTKLPFFQDGNDATEQRLDSNPRHYQKGCQSETWLSSNSIGVFVDGLQTTQCTVQSIQTQPQRTDARKTQTHRLYKLLCSKWVS